MKDLIKIGTAEVWGKFEIIGDNDTPSVMKLHYLDDSFKHHYLTVPAESSYDFIVKAIIAELYPNEKLDSFTYS